MFLHPAPTLPQNQGVPMLVPHHPNPLSQEKDIYPLCRVLVTIDNYHDYKNTNHLFRAFSGNLPETVPEKTGIRMCPLMHSMGGGGGGGVLHQNYEK